MSAPRALPRNRVPGRLVLHVLAAALSLGAAASASGHPNDVCIGIVDVGQQDEASLAATLAVEETPQMQKRARGDETQRFFLRWEWLIADAAGNPVRSLLQEAEMAPPFTVLMRPHCERPGLGDGSGGAAEVPHLRASLATGWDGTDVAGAPVPAGEYTATLSGRLVRSIATGNPADDHVNERVVGTFGPAATVFTVAGAGIRVDVIASPTSGVRPLRVRFTPEAEAEGTSILGYRWDFDGNGVFDTGFDPRPSTRVITYNQAGVFDARLEVRTQDGRTAEAVERITVVNPSPNVDVQVVPSNGPAPLEVTFAVTATSPNGSIVSVVIDPGDGTPPIELPGPGTARHTYASPGSFAATVTVTDAAGEVFTARDLSLDVRIGEEGAPTAVATASPSSGSAPLAVSLSAAGSADADGSIVLYEWDFDYDGTTFAPDASSPSPAAVAHTYTTAGTRFAALRVTDDQGLQGIDVAAVEVAIQVQVSVPDDTVNPYLGETVDVVTVLSGDTEVTVSLRDRQGARVRTLFSGFRQRGTYRDAWDGRNDAGEVLLDADYYAEAEYELGGRTLVEPDTPSGGQFLFVSWSERPSFGQTFDPWEDEFWELTFDTAARGAGASEVTLWITPFGNRGEITRTLLSSQVFGSGRFRQFWAGVKDDGSYIEPRGQRRASGNDYLWSAQAFRLPDNTIVVAGGRPTIDTLSVDANLYYPTTYQCQMGHGNLLELSLGRAAVTTVRIFNMDNGNLLRTLRTPLLPAGPQAIEWDGKADSGEFVAPGRYRAEISAVSENGNESLVRQALILVTY